MAVSKILRLRTFSHLFFVLQMAPVMEESAYREGSTSTTTLKKKSGPAHAIYHKFSLLRPDLQKGMGMPFFPPFSSIAIKFWTLTNSFPH